MNETITTLVGNVVDTPSRRTLDSGVSVTSFRVASTSRRFDRVTNRWVDGDSLYLKVTCWRSLAENTSVSLVKGDPVIVTGRLYTRLYEVAESRRAAYELEATAIGFDLNRGRATFQRMPSSRAVTVDEAGPDGLPTGSAVDAHLDTGVTTESGVAVGADPLGDDEEDERPESGPHMEGIDVPRTPPVGPDGRPLGPPFGPAGAVGRATSTSAVGRATPTGAEGRAVPTGAEGRPSPTSAGGVNSASGAGGASTAGNAGGASSASGGGDVGRASTAGGAGSASGAGGASTAGGAGGASTTGSASGAGGAGNASGAGGASTAGSAGSASGAGGAGSAGGAGAVGGASGAGGAGGRTGPVGVGGAGAAATTAAGAGGSAAEAERDTPRPGPRRRGSSAVPA
ncbi:single-stranded DNA-binding protein [Cryptosporangium aurantiacum]|uniref:Single-stranded DNA-binding protein n=1 Tax=Cryptosporangium aurantiacum TaxID=134849 RepID=A0A1M7Q9Z5_9ACTN|nr:single-stranded DNA-binding protein [Cryptosporangium aurantiacum]SHN27256.1 Single-stranded DNA-binding protein [Cryptosporangium aurantiacum]